MNVAPPPDPPRTLLIVDDEEANRTLLKTFFGKKGFGVIEAVDGPTALALIDDEVDLVLLDMMMPGQSGLEVLRALRANGRTVPVILLTAVNAVDTVVEVMQAGAQDYITKPFSLAVLLTRVERALRAPVDEVAIDDVIAVDDLRIAIPSDDLIDDDTARVPPPSSSLSSLLPSTAPTVPGSTLPQPVSPSSSSLPRAAGLWSRLGAITRRVLPGEQPGLEVGAILSGRYRLAERLGAGAFGTVWRARHIDLDADMAVKVLHKDAQPVRPHETALESFRKEAVLASRVSSPHAVRVTDFGQSPEGHAWLVMEFLRGESLRARLTRLGPLGLREACGTVADVCEALACAHRVGVVHRDVKALNVFLAQRDDEEGRTIVKLIDFGAAGSTDDPRGGTVLVGTPTHMAPERFVQADGSPASDVYAAGIMLFHLLTGAVPFSSSDVHALATLHRSEPVPPPSSRRADVAMADTITLRLLEKNPADRPHAKEAAAALRAIARQR